MTAKDEILEIIRRLPAEVSLPEILATLQLRLKIDQGLREIEEGKSVPHEQAKARLQKWLK